MSAATLFATPPRRFHWDKAPHDLTMRPDCKPEYAKLILTLLYLADGKTTVNNLRREILATSGLKVGKYLEGMDWLRNKLGAIRDDPGGQARSRRTIVLEWTRPEWEEREAREQGEQGAEAGARQERAPEGDAQEKGKEGGARQGRAPATDRAPTCTKRPAIDGASATERPDRSVARGRGARPSYRENSGEQREQKNVTSRALASPHAREADAPADGTGRDGFAALHGEGQGENEAGGVGIAEPEGRPEAERPAEEQPEAEPENGEQEAQEPAQGPPSNPERAGDAGPQEATPGKPPEPEGTAAPPKIRAAPAEIDAAIAERVEEAAALVAAAGGSEAIMRPGWRVQRMQRDGALCEVVRLCTGDVTPIRPQPPKIHAPKPDILPPAKAKKPREVVPDETFPLEIGLAMIAELDDHEAGPEQADRVAEFLSRRWRDPKPETIDHFREACGIGAENLARIARYCDREGENPAKLFSSRTTTELKKNRAAKLARQQRLNYRREEGEVHDTRA